MPPRLSVPEMCAPGATVRTVLLNSPNCAVELFATSVMDSIPVHSKTDASPPPITVTIVSKEPVYVPGLQSEALAGEESAAKRGSAWPASSTTGGGGAASTVIEASAPFWFAAPSGMSAPGEAEAMPPAEFPCDVPDGTADATP